VIGLEVFFEIIKEILDYLALNALETEVKAR